MFKYGNFIDSTPRFFDEGYADGYEHGRIHGLIEGGELGREKGFEMWEELGFYEGFALVMKAGQTQKEASSRLLFSCLPTTNANG